MRTLNAVTDSEIAGTEIVDLHIEIANLCSAVSDAMVKQSLWMVGGVLAATLSAVAALVR